MDTIMCGNLEPGEEWTQEREDAAKAKFWFGDAVEEVLQPPPPFSVLYCPVLNEWEISCREPMSVDHAYTDAGKGRKRRVLVADAQMWRTKLRNAIAFEWEKKQLGYLGLPPWDETRPMSYWLTWYPKKNGGDLSNRIKLFEDAINSTAIWKDDKQVHYFRATKVEDSSQPGIIFVRIKHHPV